MCFLESSSYDQVEVEELVKQELKHKFEEWKVSKFNLREELDRDIHLNSWNRVKYLQFNEINSWESEDFLLGWAETWHSKVESKEKVFMFQITCSFFWEHWLLFHRDNRLYFMNQKNMVYIMNKTILWFH